MLNQSYQIGKYTIPNRVVFQPMEGCDCNPDGSPSELTIRKYMKFAQGQGGIIWFEANGVCPEGLTSPRQMHLTKDNLDAFKKLVDDVRETAQKTTGTNPLLILQLTHSGRQSVNPLTMYDNPVYEAVGRGGTVVTDEYLDSLPENYCVSTALAEAAGFDGIDVKACHGYLLSEAFSAFNREGKYGGSFENRTRLYRNCFEAAKQTKKADTLLTARLGLCDMVAKPNGFATDEDGNLDLTESVKLVSNLAENGLQLLNITIGNPYYNPHINRPFKLGGYVPNEPPETGLARFRYVNKTIKDANPNLPIVGSGLSYYRSEMFDKAEEMLVAGECDFAGFGRMILAYPEFYRDYCNGTFDSKKLCALCSKCTVLMRKKSVSGCAIHDPVYREILKELSK